MNVRQRRARTSALPVAPTTAPTNTSARAALVTAVVSALVVLGPALRPGYVLVGDMVFVPRLRIDGNLIGLSSTTPRAVPSDAVVALLSAVLPGQVVQKLVLFAVLLAAGVGAGLVVRMGAIGTSAATAAAVWNPYVGERLAAGQWAVLVGYAALPWVLRGAWEWGAVSSGDRSTTARRAWLRVAVPVVLGSLGGPPAWFLVVLVALVGWVVGARARVLYRGGALLGGLLLLLALPWAVPALIRPGGTVANASGAVFAPRADTPFGLLVSILTGGGIWNSDVVPAGRDTIPGAVAGCALLVLGVSGLVVARRRVALAAGLAGVLGLALALLVALPDVGPALAGWSATALLRDGARQVGPWVVAMSVGVGVAVDAVAQRRGVWRVAGGIGPAVALALLPVATSASMGWGLAGRLAPVDYPHDYAQVAARVAGPSAAGAVVVVPFEAYRRAAWNRERSALDPLPRWLPAVTVASSDLLVRGPAAVVRVPGEDPFAAAVHSALASTRPAVALARLGVRWVVVDQPGVSAPAGVVPRWAGPQLRLFEVPGVDPVAARDPGRRWRPALAPVVVTDLLVAVLTLVALAIPGRRRRATSKPHLRPNPGDTVR
jgi:hypothetical protein